MRWVRAAATVRDSNAGNGSKKKRDVMLLRKTFPDNTLGHATRARSLRFPASIVPRAPHVVAVSLRVSEWRERKAVGGCRTTHRILKTLERAPCRFARGRSGVERCASRVTYDRSVT